MLHKDRKWNHHAYGEESVAAYAQNQRRHKTNEDDMTYNQTGGDVSTKIILLFSLSLDETYAIFKISFARTYSIVWYFLLVKSPFVIQ